MQYQEIEVRFLNIDKENLIQRLRSCGAVDRGEDMLTEIIFYDRDLTWRDSGGTFMRLRTQNAKTRLAYKHRRELTADGTDEIEFEVSDGAAATELLTRIGFVPYRHQEKKRHTFELNGVTVDIDEWPRIPPYVELEGPNEESLKQCASALDLDWAKVEMRTPRMLIEQVYGVPVGKMTWFTFSRFE